MKKFTAFLITFALACVSLHAIQPAMQLTGQDYNLRVYLDSVQKALQGESAWSSITAVQAATSDYTTTTVIYPVIKLVDDDGRPMYWFNDTISGFSKAQSVSGTTAATGTAGATLSTGTLTFVAGSASAMITLTGDWSIGDTVTLSAPALSDFVTSVSLKSQVVLTFTTN